MKKKFKVKFVYTGSKKEQEERLGAAYNILFTEIAKKLKKKN